MSLHPPHLVDTNGTLTPAALIPFCGYQASMALFGQKMPDIPFPICTGFKPTVLEGQLCYSLKVNKEGIERPRQGEGNGLFIVLDPSVRSVGIAPDSVKTQGEMAVSLAQASQEESSVRVYMNTLDRFSGYTAGSYAMSSLKSMLVTDNFLDLPDDTKACQEDAYEECHTQRYLKQCGCVPWALGWPLADEVRAFVMQFKIIKPDIGLLFPECLGNLLQYKYPWVLGVLHRTLHRHELLG